MAIRHAQFTTIKFRIPFNPNQPDSLITAMAKVADAVRALKEGGAEEVESNSRLGKFKEANGE